MNICFYICEVIYNSMVVVVLPPAKSFAGVSYNERKNEQGKSELLVAENFAMNPERLKKSDYIAYMESVCMANPSVKAKQFHAVISCKGNENSVDELKSIALQYVHKMGYGENPFLIYFHSDTNNNHVHIVSTRVRKDGKKVKDNMEAVRSQRIINQIMNVDLPLKAKSDMAKYMEFSFSTVQQYKLLLEQVGWKVGEKDGMLSLHKGGEVQATIPLEKIKKRSELYNPDQDRRKQLTALLCKYKDGLTYTELQTLMLEKFGVKLVFHTGKGHTNPYGYTVIDYKNKAVFKGSEIMDLKILLEEPDKKAKIDHCNAIISAILKDGIKYTLEDFKSSMANYGYNLSMDGSISLKGDKKVLLTLNDELLKELRYNSRVYEANKFKASSLKEAELLSKIYRVKIADVEIKSSNNVEKDKNYLIYADMMNSYLAHASDLRDILQEKNFVFIEDKGTVYLIDKQEKIIVSSDDLGINIKEQNSGRDRITIVSADNLDRVGVEHDPELARGVNILDAVCEILGQHINVQQESPNRKRKKGQQQK